MTLPLATHVGIWWTTMTTTTMTRQWSNPADVKQHPVVWHIFLLHLLVVVIVIVVVFVSVKDRWLADWKWPSRVINGRPFNWTDMDSSSLDFPISTSLRYGAYHTATSCRFDSNFQLDTKRRANYLALFDQTWERELNEARRSRRYLFRRSR